MKHVPHDYEFPAVICTRCKKPLLRQGVVWVGPQALASDPYCQPCSVIVMAASSTAAPPLDARREVKE